MLTIFAMAIAFGVVITFVVPQFKDIFEQSGAELPFPTRLLLWIEYALTTYGPLILVGAILLLIVITSYSIHYTKLYDLAMPSPGTNMALSMLRATLSTISFPWTDWLIS